MTAWILSTCAIIIVLMLLRHFLKGRVDPRLTYALWLLAALRVLIPVSLFHSPVSVAELTERAYLDDMAHVTGWLLQPRINKDFDLPEDSIEAKNALFRELAREGYDFYDDIDTRRTDSGAVVRLKVSPAALGLSYWNWVHIVGSGLTLVVLVVSNARFAAALKKRRRRYEGDLPVDCPLKVYIVEDLPSPCLFGLFRPKVYINQAALDSGRLDHVLTHELTHYRHGDQWWAVLRCLCLCVQWFDPLVWAAARCSREDCESACDASAIKALGEDQRAGYGRTLVAMIAAGAKSPILRTATTMTGGVGEIYRRVTLIARKPKMTALTIAVVALVAAVAVGCTFSGAAETERPREVPAPASAASPSETAQAVFNAIVGTPEDRDFYVSVWDGAKVDGEYHITRNGYNVDHVGYYLSSFSWYGADMTDQFPGGRSITLKDQSGAETLSFTCFNSGLVHLYWEGRDRWYTCAPKEGATLYEYMLIIAEDAALEDIWSTKVDRSVTVHTDVVRQYAEAAARKLAALPEWHRERPLHAVLNNYTVDMAYLGEPENFCGGFGLYFKLENGEASNWQAGAGMERVAEGPYAGYWGWGTGVSFMRDRNGDWVCTGRYTGGEELVYPVPLEESTVEQLVDDWFHSEGEAPLCYRIPLELRRRSLEELSALNDILGRYSAAQAQDLCDWLGVHTARFPEYANVTCDTLAPVLEEPYRSWLTEGYDSAAWLTGGHEDGEETDGLCHLPLQG